VTKDPLYRRVNTKARGVHHNSGGEYRHQRNTNTEALSEGLRQSMHGKVRRGLDYTPLFRFLLSKVGSPWNQVHAEAVARLDKPDPIFWLVAAPGQSEQEYVRVGESSYFSGLRINEAGLLELVNASIGPSSLAPLCGCCTHTFNGVRFTKQFGGVAVTPSQQRGTSAA
jgi:hypothetical protein